MNNKLVPMPSPPALLAFHIAERESSNNPLWTEEEICEHFDITMEQLAQFKTLPSFRAEVRANLAEIKDSNSHIRRKASAQAELFLDTLVPSWLRDDDFPPAEKVKLMALLLKTGRVIDDPLEKAKAEAEVAAKTPQISQQPTLNLYLTTAPGATPVVIDATSERIISEQ